jgi:hypothetical protein
MTTSAPTSTRDLRPSERRFLAAMRQLGFGRIEFLRIERGELVLDPWPTVVRDIKFGATDPVAVKQFPEEFELKRQVTEFFQYVRSVDSGEIRTLEIHNGLPFSMEIELRPELNGGRRRA